MPGGPGADGTAGQGAHDAFRSEPGKHVAAETDQSQGALSRDPGFLRTQPAIAVHGPDQSAGRTDPQAAAFSPWAWRFVPGPGGFRGARRSPFALRENMPG